MKTIGIFAALLLLTGCEHNFLLVKAGHVKVNGNPLVVRCLVTADDYINPELKRKANELCDAVHNAYAPPHIQPRNQGPQ